jgi:tRNA pseudouridine55 synthase
MESRGPDGFLVLDKPAGPTSRDVINRIQRWFPPRTRVGHAGTLDPLATGVLVAAVGAATKLVSYVQSMPKTYQARLRLGQVSDTDDAAGHTEVVSAAEAPSPPMVQECLERFCGEIEQIPPNFSAAKQDGRRAYHLARRGQQVSLKPRRVHVYSIEVVHYEYPDLDLVVKCGKGTYIRALARDIGQELRCGALVQSLRRTAIGAFTLEQAVDLNLAAGQGRQRLLPLAVALSDLPNLELSQSEIVRFRQGQRLTLQQPLEPVGERAVYDQSQTLIGIGRIDAKAILQPVLVL